MVDFKLTEEQKRYQQLARDFARNEIAPIAERHDHSGEPAMEIYRQSWEMGLMNAQVPEAFGGLGLSVFDSCLIAEEIAAGCTGIGAAIEANNVALAPVIMFGNEVQQAEFVKPLMDELGFASYCVQEGPNGGNGDLERISTAARKHDGDYVLNGHKISVVNASIAKWFFVLAKTGEHSDSPLSAFLVPSDLGGITVGPKKYALGRRAADVRDVTLDEVHVPARWLLGGQGHGAEIVRKSLDRTCPLIAASAVGLARSAMENAIKYSKERQTFGTPIANHQAVSFMLADMAKDIESSRLLVYQAAWLADKGTDNRCQAEMAKALACDTAMKVATDAVQVFGGYGYSREYPVEKLMRDAKVYQIYEGTTNAHRVNIAKELIGVV